jgi:hypothetical protein
MIDVVTASDAVCMILREHCADQLTAGAVVALPFNPPPRHHISARPPAFVGGALVPYGSQDGGTKVLPASLVITAMMLNCVRSSFGGDHKYWLAFNGSNPDR